MRCAPSIHRVFASVARVRALAAAAAVAVLAIAGCAKHHTPTAPLAQLPPGVIGTAPAARSLHVFTDTPIWAQFDRALDPSTVDTRHVFLKVDTRRLPIQVSYDASQHRIVIDAGAGLLARATHTVEFAPGLRTADGDSLGRTYFWQFTTFSVRRPDAPYPNDGASGESPFAELLWRGTDAAAGTIVYGVSAAADSAALATHTLPVVASGLRTFYVPAARWLQAGPVYWSVRATNTDTGEWLDGPVWRFDPLPGSTPVDTVLLLPTTWLSGTLYGTSPYFYSAQCNPKELLISRTYDNLTHWNFASLGPGVRLAGGMALVTPVVASRDGTTHGLVLSTAAQEGTLCTPLATPPYQTPVAGTLLARAQARVDTRLGFDADLLTAFAESVARHGGSNATVFSSTTDISLLTAYPGAVPYYEPMLVLEVYRPAPAAARMARR